jgi:hypothetical protein
LPTGILKEPSIWIFQILHNLAKIIPDKETKILIYCNNNFEGDEINFASKIAIPKPEEKDKRYVTLALNIPTYINLYGYGYKNVYELSELVNVFDGRVQYEGLSVQNVKSQNLELKNWL